MKENPITSITLPQAQAMVDSFGGANAEALLFDFPEGRIRGDDDEPMPAGLYLAFADCLEEGAIYLGEHDPDAVAEAVPPAIPLDDHTRDILGTMCFQCISIATALRAMGHDIPTKAEAEQAAVIHWKLNLYLAHGDKWREAGSQQLKAGAAALTKAPQQ